MARVPDDATVAHVQHRHLDLAAAPRPAEDVAVDRALATICWRCTVRSTASMRSRSRAASSKRSSCAARSIAPVSSRSSSSRTAAQEQRRSLDELRVAPRRRPARSTAPRQRFISYSMQGRPRRRVVAEHRAREHERSGKMLRRFEIASRSATLDVYGPKYARAVLAEAPHRRRAAATARAGRGAGTRYCLSSRRRTLKGGLWRLISSFSSSSASFTDGGRHLDVARRARPAAASATRPSPPARK